MPMTVEAFRQLAQIPPHFPDGRLGFHFDVLCDKLNTYSRIDSSAEPGRAMEILDEILDHCEQAFWIITEKGAREAIANAIELLDEQADMQKEALTGRLSSDFASFPPPSASSQPSPRPYPAAPPTARTAHGTRTECPRCKSPNTKNKGEGLGRKRYHCLNCKRDFYISRETGLPIEVTPKRHRTPNQPGTECPNCKSTTTRKRGVKNGLQKHLCMKCNHFFSTSLKTGLPVEVISHPKRPRNQPGIQCPRCLATDTQKRGITGGRQRHSCMKCRKIFHDR